MTMQLGGSDGVGNICSASTVTVHVIAVLPVERIGSIYLMISSRAVCCKWGGCVCVCEPANGLPSVGPLRVKDVR